MKLDISLSISDFLGEEKFICVRCFEIIDDYSSAACTRSAAFFEQVITTSNDCYEWGWVSSMSGCFCVFVQFFLSFCHCFTAAVQKCNCEECSADRCSCFVLTFHCAVLSRFHSRVKFTVCTVHLKQTFFSDTGAGDCQMRTRPALRIGSPSSTFSNKIIIAEISDDWWLGHVVNFWNPGHM